MKRLIRGNPLIFRAGITSVVVGVVGVGVVLAEDLYVNSEHISMREGPTIVDNVVETVDQGEKLTVIQSNGNDPSDWVQVAHNNKSGWVARGDLSPQAVGPYVATNYGSSASSGTDVTMAGKGAFDEHDYAKQKGYSEEAFNTLKTQYENGSALITPQTLKGFMSSGKVGPKSLRTQSPT